MRNDFSQVMLMLEGYCPAITILGITIDAEKVKHLVTAIENSLSLRKLEFMAVKFSPGTLNRLLSCIKKNAQIIEVLFKCRFENRAEAITAAEINQLLRQRQGGYERLLAACAGGFTDTVTTYLKQGLHPDGLYQPHGKSEITPLQVSLRHHKPDIAKYLLKVKLAHNNRILNLSHEQVKPGYITEILRLAAEISQEYEDGCIEVLNLSHCAIDFESLTRMQKNLTALVGIRHLNLAGNLLTDESIDFLKGLAEKNGLLSLNLYNNFIKSSTLSAIRVCANENFMSQASMKRCSVLDVTKYVSNHDAVIYLACKKTGEHAKIFYEYLHENSLEVGHIDLTVPTEKPWSAFFSTNCKINIVSYTEARHRDELKRIHEFSKRHHYQVWQVDKKDIHTIIDAAQTVRTQNRMYFSLAHMFSTGNNCLSFAVELLEKAGIKFHMNQLLTPRSAAAGKIVPPHFFSTTAAQSTQKLPIAVQSDLKRKRPEAQQAPQNIYTLCSQDSIEAVVVTESDDSSIDEINERSILEWGEGQSELIFCDAWAIYLLSRKSNNNKIDERIVVEGINKRQQMFWAMYHIEKRKDSNASAQPKVSRQVYYEVDPGVLRKNDETRSWLQFLLTQQGAYKAILHLGETIEPELVKALIKNIEAQRLFNMAPLLEPKFDSNISWAREQLSRIKFEDEPEPLNTEINYCL